MPADGSLWSRVKEMTVSLLVGASVYMPFLQPLLTQPGDGPARADMEQGILYMYVCVCVCTYIHTCVCVYIHTYMYVCMYIHVTS